jgi:hypothetical protein
MGWNELPYWLKGGIIFGGISLLFFIIQLILILISGPLQGNTSNTLEALIIVFRYYLLLFPLGILKFIFSSISGNFYPNDYTKLNAIISIVLYFTIGALIGYIYGKMRGTN